MPEEPVRIDESFVADQPSSQGQKIALTLLSIGLCGLLIYALLERHSAKELNANLNDLSAALNREHSQVETLTQRLIEAESTLTAKPVPAVAAAPETQEVTKAKPAAVQHHSTRHNLVAKARPAEDPWRKEIQSELTEQQKLISDHQRQIQETKQSVEQTRTEFQGNLQTTRDDLNGSIAKNHEELVALERKGERNFYEFDLLKSKQFHKTGPVSISVRKATSKHKFCDLVIIVNDSEVSKKHVNLYESVSFYPEGFSQPLQLVINNITNGGARGYVSEPKYKAPETAASGSSVAGTEAASAGQNAPSSSAETATLKRRSE